jgi:uncharacterized phage protein gp47/JayE
MTTARPRIDYTNKDYASLVDAMLALGRERIETWTDQSPNDFGVLLVELFAAMGDALFYYQDRIAAESYLDTAVERRSVVQMLRLIGYELRPPVPASAQLTLLFDPAGAPVTIDPGATFSTAGTPTTGPIGFQYVRDRIAVDPKTLPTATLDKQGVVRLVPPSTPQAYALYRSLPVVQVDAAVANEVVGSSDGSAGQRFALARRPLIADSLRVAVDDGTGPREWTRVESLLRSLATDETYAVRRDENDVAWIELGDGRYGKIPPRGRNNVIASYRIGGGARGNVSPNAITQAITTLPGLKAVTNEAAATAGAEAEPTADAALRAPRQYRSMGRAVTASDYQAHALSFGVAKALAVATGPSRVEVYVAPAGGGQPTDTLISDLVDYFEDKRMLTVQVDVRGPEYVNVTIEAALVVEPRYDAALVQQQAEAAIETLWSFEQVGFGEPLFISKAYEVIQEVPGVAGVNITRFTAGALDAKNTVDGRLALGPTQIPRLASARGIDFTSVKKGGRNG